MKIAIEKPLLKSLTVMAAVVEARDAYTGGHLWRVSQYSQFLARASGLSPEMVFLARLGGFLHDIGKIAIPDGVLGKQGELTPAQFEVVRTHPGIGATLIQEHPLGLLAIHAVHQHHEWVNGMGYPGRLQGEQISILARIVCIVDAFDALTSSRPYRQGGTTTAAIEALNIERDTQFDGALLDSFNRLATTGDLETIVGHSASGVPLVACPSCGPVIVVSQKTRDGDLAYCRVCGAQHRVHRKQDTFEVEPTKEMATAEQLKPKPEWGTLQKFISQAPGSIEI